MQRGSQLSDFIPKVTFSGNRITINKLDHPRVVTEFIKACKSILDQDCCVLEIDVSGTEKVFPNACVPIAAALQVLNFSGIPLKFIGLSHYLEASRFNKPIVATEANLMSESDPLSRIWSFRDERAINLLNNHFVKACQERLDLKKGVAPAIEWCLNEVMDNVLQHSQSTHGYIMAQVHPATNRFAICLSDHGIGIFESLRYSKHHPLTPLDAITIAVKEGVTRDKNVGQGNGLWGLFEVLKINQGQLCITSGPASLMFKDCKEQTFKDLPYLHSSFQGTTIDFQIRTDSEIDIADALVGYSRPVSLILEELETDAGNVVIVIKDHSHGTGTRRSGERLRTYICNIVEQCKKRVTLDFAGIGIISSSFADEVLGKLIVKYGFYNFSHLIQMINMNDTIQGIVQRSVGQRMKEEFTK